MNIERVEEWSGRYLRRLLYPLVRDVYPTGESPDSSLVSARQESKREGSYGFRYPERRGFKELYFLD